MESSVRKNLLLQSLKAGVIAFAISCIGVLVLALIAKLCNIGDTALPIINQVIKVLAMGLGVFIAVKDEKHLFKALIAAVIFWILSFAMFMIMGGQIHFGQIALDLVISLVTAVIVALIKKRRA